MDVTPHGLRDVPEVADFRKFAADRRPNVAVERTAPPAPTPEKAAAPPEEAEKPREEQRSSLKFSVRAADVDAKFEIHEATKKVTVTMYNRETGEVLREFPSRHVLDAIASLTDNGLHVDTTS